MAIFANPAYPLPNESVVISSSGTIGEVQIVEITSAPSASTKELGYLIQDSDIVPNNIFDIAENRIESDTTTFDEPGEYGVTVYDLRQWPGIPSFPGDSAGVERWEIISSSIGTVNVSAHVTLPMLTGSGQGVTLQLAINNDTVRASALIDPVDEKSRLATLQSTVTAALAAIVGSTVSSIGTDLQTGVQDLLTNYEAHRETAVPVHSNKDVTNAVTRFGAKSQDGAVSLLNELRIKLLQHMQDSTSTKRAWHVIEEDDLKNLPLAQSAFDLGTATVLSADLRERAYERHREQISSPGSHGSKDTTNFLAGPSLLDDIVVSYFDALAALNPSAITGEPMGALEAGHRYGFRT